MNGFPLNRNLNEIRDTKDGNVRLSEDDIQRQVVDYLRAEGCLVLENRSNVRDAILNRVSGNRDAVGSPDLIAVTREGRVLWLELKAVKGKQSEKQRQWEIELRGRKQAYYLVYSLEDAQRLVDVIRAREAW